MQHKNPKLFAERLASLVQQSGLAKKTIAERARIHPVTLSKYLSGKRIPATEELHNVASILRVTTHWLLTGEGDPKPVNLDDIIAKEAAGSAAGIAGPGSEIAKPSTTPNQLESPGGEKDELLAAGRRRVLELADRCAAEVADAVADIGSMLELAHTASTAKLAASMITGSKQRLDEFAEWSASQRRPQAAATEEDS